MSEVLSASAGLSFSLDVTFGILLAVVLTVTAELLARYQGNLQGVRGAMPCKARPHLQETSAVHCFQPSLIGSDDRSILVAVRPATRPWSPSAANRRQSAVLRPRSALTIGNLLRR